LVRANRSGCLDQCERGPTVVIYPQAIWYGRVTPEDVPRIIEDTILGGRVLEDLRIADEQLNCPFTRDTSGPSPTGTSPTGTSPTGTSPTGTSGYAP
jgi:(2Fe-2S) ferredoxin